MLPPSNIKNVEGKGPDATPVTICSHDGQDRLSNITLGTVHFPWFRQLGLLPFPGDLSGNFQHNIRIISQPLSSALGFEPCSF
jgi:hypothetical protein